MRVSGGTVGTGSGVAVPVGVGGAASVDVIVGMAVGPSEMGSPLQAAMTSAIRGPNMVRKGFMGVLILVKRRRVNGRNLYAPP
jgi:hypothetical protein